MLPQMGHPVCSSVLSYCPSVRTPINASIILLVCLLHVTVCTCTVARVWVVAVVLQDLHTVVEDLASSQQ